MGGAAAAAGASKATSGRASEAAENGRAAAAAVAALSLSLLLSFAQSRHRRWRGGGAAAAAAGAAVRWERVLRESRPRCGCLPCARATQPCPVCLDIITLFAFNSQPACSSHASQQPAARQASTLQPRHYCTVLLLRVRHALLPMHCAPACVCAGPYF